MEKSCIICNKVKPLGEYYKHSQMGDGHLNKCKQCTKEQSKAREEKLRQNPEWVESEKIRAREKYNRLGYKDKHKPDYEHKKVIMDKYKAKYPEKRSAKNLSAKLKPIIKGNQLHHWNYNIQFAKDVIELSVKNHKKLHRYLIYDEVLFIYKRSDTLELLDTREKHELYMFDVLANKPD